MTMKLYLVITHGDQFFQGLGTQKDQQWRNMIQPQLKNSYYRLCNLSDTLSLHFISFVIFENDAEKRDKAHINCR